MNTSQAAGIWMTTALNSGNVAVTHCNEAFAFAPGHPMRGTTCIVCDQPIGGEHAAVIGVAALEGETCTCSRLTADSYLIHAKHIPFSHDEFIAAINRALWCIAEH